MGTKFESARQDRKGKVLENNQARTGVVRNEVWDLPVTCFCFLLKVLRRPAWQVDTLFSKQHTVQPFESKGTSGEASAESTAKQGYMSDT